MVGRGIRGRSSEEGVFRRLLSLYLSKLRPSRGAIRGLVRRCER